MVVVRNDKKIEKNEYFIEISYKIDKLMWVFYKSDSVKQKKQVFLYKIDRKFRRTDVDALTYIESQFTLINYDTIVIKRKNYIFHQLL